METSRECLACQIRVSEFIGNVLTEEATNILGLPFLHLKVLRLQKNCEVECMMAVSYSVQSPFDVVPGNGSQSAVEGGLDVVVNYAITSVDMREQNVDCP